MATTRHPNNSGLPRYMQKRTNISGPNIGFPMVLSLGPMSMTATVRPVMFKLPKAFRLIAFGWSMPATTGTTCTLAFGQDNANDNSAAAQAFLSPNSVDLLTVPTGVVYFNDTSAASFIQKVSANDPEVLVATNPYLKIAIVINTTTVTNLNCYVLGWLTEHINADKAND